MDEQNKEIEIQSEEKNKEKLACEYTIVDVFKALLEDNEDEEVE